MSSNEVVKALGRPSAIRRGGLGEDYINEVFMLYGTVAWDRFASNGIVVLNNAGYVVNSYSPLSNHGWSSIITNRLRSPQGLQCRVETVEVPELEETLEPRFQTPVMVTFSIGNEGREPFTLTLDDPALWVYAAVEVCDVRKRPLYRQYFKRYHKASSPFPDQWCRLTIQPEAKYLERFYLWAGDVHFGDLPNGDYLLRVYFPLDGTNLYPSEWFKWSFRSLRHQ